MKIKSNIQSFMVCNRYLCKGIGLLFFAALFFLSINAQDVQVGLGSYSTTLPPGASGPQWGNGEAAFPKVSADFNQKVQTNDFWSSIIFPFYGNVHSNILQAHPLQLKAIATGMEMGYSDSHILTGTDYIYPYTPQLVVSVAGMSAPLTFTESYGDWTVTLSWVDGEKSMEATLGHGLPYVFYEVTGGDVFISPTSAAVVWWQEDEVLGITVNGKHYGVFAPTGSTWSGSGPFQSALNGAGYLSVAILPDNTIETIELFRNHAYAFVTNSTVSWSYDEASAVVTSTYSYETRLMDSATGNSNETLTALYRHQWLNTADALLDHTYISPRGTMKLKAGNNFTTQMTFQGVLPTLPDVGSYNRTTLSNLVDDYAFTPLPSGDTYFNGQEIAKYANLLHITDQLGESAERDYFLAAMKFRLEEWLTAGGEQEYSYNADWDVLTGYPSGFGADTQINDHHFHHAYSIYSAAAVAQYDSAWAAPDNWGGMVNMLIRDAASWDREDPLFPFLRNFDIYAGHSWASGHSDFPDGNNQESSSESINFAVSAILWGEATGQTDIRDMGIFLYTTEVAAIEQYWFDVEDVVYPVDYPFVALGIVWGAKGAHTTWFGSNPEFIHGINLLPVNSGSLYLGRHPEYVVRNYNAMAAASGGQPTLWKDVMWQYLALADPNRALNNYLNDPDYEPFHGESRAHTYHWLYNIKKMGQVETGITADIPTYAVFRDAADDLTYVAYNAGPTERLVTYSDGFSITVPSRATVSHSTSPADPNAPVVVLGADQYTGRAPLTVQFSGGNSTDPNNLPLGYAWNFADGSTSDQPNPEHVFTTPGNYAVSLTVTNSSELSATESVTITVLQRGTPWTGEPMPVPGRVEAEFFDLGGEGLAYHDNDVSNNGGAFRTEEAVDIESTVDTDGGFNVGWTDTGEWIEYTIEVAEAGNYDVSFRVASLNGGGNLHLEFNGVDKTGLIAIAATGGWQDWQTVAVNDIALEAGLQVMRLAIDNGGFNLNWIELIDVTTGIDDHVALPLQYALKQNYPNPFNPETRIEYSLPIGSPVTLEVFNTAGQLVATLLNQHQPAGTHRLVFDASGYASGTYFYRIRAGEYQATRKMLILK
jgi:endoglucanase Acf2/PKD repeat protein